MSKPKSVDRQVESLKRRLKTERDTHAKTVAAKNRELAALRDSWQLFDVFPNLEDLLVWLHKIRDAASPLKPASYEVRSKGVSDPTGSSAVAPNADRSRVERVNRDLAAWTARLADYLAPKGRLVDDEISVVRPRCFNPECPARLIPQAFDQEQCYECKMEFTAFREKPLRRCWTRSCAMYGLTGQCDHVER